MMGNSDSKNLCYDDPELCEFKLTCRRINTSIVVTIPVDFCKLHNIKGDNEIIRVIIHQIIFSGKDKYTKKDLCHVRY
jgi:hypothetical protein